MDRNVVETPIRLAILRRKNPPPHALTQRLKTMSYRKIDVDSLDEDRYLEDDEIIAVAAKVTAEGGEVQVANFTNYKLEPPASAADTEKLVEQCAAEVRSIINR